MEHLDTKTPVNNTNMGEISVKGIVRNARASHTQIDFVVFLKEKYQIESSQALISKYESGKANPPAEIIDVCMKIIHSKNIPGEVSLNELEEKIRKVLTGPGQAQARKAFAVILDHLS